MTETILAGAATFALVFVLLRGVEWLYHRLRRTPDWSPHWGSWVFALLSAVYAVVNNLGRL
jgi:TRAP-type mannitol/chloroaromatic compound transport system permease large subunit